MPEIDAAPYLEAMRLVKQLLDTFGNHYDEANAHPDADDILCALLRTLGYGEIVDAYDSIDKWYD